MAHKLAGGKVRRRDDDAQLPVRLGGLVMAQVGDRIKGSEIGRPDRWCLCVVCVDCDAGRWVQDKRPLPCGVAIVPESYIVTAWDC